MVTAELFNRNCYLKPVYLCYGVFMKKIKILFHSTQKYVLRYIVFGCKLFVLDIQAIGIAAKKNHLA